MRCELREPAVGFLNRMSCTFPGTLVYRGGGEGGLDPPRPSSSPSAINIVTSPTSSLPPGGARDHACRCSPHPLSRKPGSSASALRSALEGAGLRYEHWRALGNPHEIRDLFKAGNVAEGRRLFRERLRNGQSAAVDSLVELASHACGDPVPRSGSPCLSSGCDCEEASDRSGHRLLVTHCRTARARTQPRMRNMFGLAKAFPV